MLTDKQLDIFASFVKYPFKERTRQEIKNLSNEKSNNALSIAFSQFKKEKLILEQKVGKSSIYKLNFDNALTLHYLALCNNKRLKKVVKSSLTDVFVEVKKITSFFTLITINKLVNTFFHNTIH